MMLIQPNNRSSVRFVRKGNTGRVLSVMGYAKSGDDLLTTVNQYGIGYVVSDYYSNGSFWCSYPNKSFKQRPGVALEKVEAGKVYVSIIFSDGDNLQFDQNALYAIWTEDSLRGDIPVGTTLAAGLQEINPFLLEWYYSHKVIMMNWWPVLRDFNSYTGEIIRRRGMMSGWNLTGNGWHRPDFLWVACGIRPLERIVSTVISRLPV